MSKSVSASFSRRMPDNVTEELVAVLSSRASFEFKPLFDIILLNLRERNAASGGEEMLRLRVYEKLQGGVDCLGSPFATVRRVMPGQISIGGFSRFISQNPTPEVYPLGFAPEGS